MYEKILLPLDGSKTGEAALPYIEDLVSKLLPQTQVEVTLLQVITSVGRVVVAGEAVANIPYTEQETEQINKLAKDYLNKAGEVLRSRGATVTAKVTMGHAAEEIIKTADETNTDLIAMSTHGRSGLSSWAFGSVTARVLRGGNKPVLMIRAKE